MSFTALDPQDIVVSSDSTISPMWSDNTLTLNAYYTSSTQESSTPGTFYLDLYQSLPSDANASVQFSVAYGHISGSGSAYFNPSIPNRTPTRDIYGQFRTLVYGDENGQFTFGTLPSGSKDIIVLSVNRARFKESFNPGSLTLRISSGSNSIVLTDDSTVAASSTYIGTSRVYQLLSGSANNVSSSAYTVSGSYGMVIPDEGLIILNPRALSLAAGALGGIGMVLNESTSATVAAANLTYNINNRMIYQMLSSSAVTTPTASLQNLETISSTYFFVRVRNSDYNYTTNPTVIDNNGNLLYSQLIYNPQTFITTVGLYNNSGDLLAVAKLNKPLVKDFTKELLLRVKLDF